MIDYYWYHQPDGVTPIAETLETLHELVAGRQGALDRRVELQRRADRGGRRGRRATGASRRFTAIQNNYSLLVRDAERDVLPTCERLGIGFVPFFPLASGLLTGKYHRGEPAPEGTRLAARDEVASDEQFDVVEAVARFADERGVSMIDVAIGALLARPAVSTVIAGRHAGPSRCGPTRPQRAGRPAKVTLPNSMSP